MSSIYTPRGSIDLLLNPLTQDITNKQVCTKIEFRGYEISISMDSSHTNGDLFRSDIRVFSLLTGEDVSLNFLADGCSMIYGSSEELFRIMTLIIEYTEK